ncbi:MAG: hypothetical protein ACF8QF_06830 [Phycisphaerales bacterium]
MATPARRIRPLRTLVVLLALCAFAPGALAQGQRSPNDLRVENDRLKERIEDLESQLDAAQKRIDSLESTVDRLREQLRNRQDAPSGAPSGDQGDAGGDQPREREMAPTPDEPFASLPSMVMYLRGAYMNAFQNHTIGDGRDREEYLREVRGWARETVRDARGQIEWTIRVVDVADQQGSRTQFLVENFDTQRGLPIGLPFPLEVVGRNAVRLRDGADGLWTLEGVLQSDIEVDENMPTIESADDPAAYLGPFARYTYEIAVRSLREAN